MKFLQIPSGVLESGRSWANYNQFTGNICFVHLTTWVLINMFLEEQKLINTNKIRMRINRDSYELQQALRKRYAPSEFIRSGGFRRKRADNRITNELQPSERTNHFEIPSYKRQMVLWSKAWVSLRFLFVKALHTFGGELLNFNSI